MCVTIGFAIISQLRTKLTLLPVGTDVLDGPKTNEFAQITLLRTRVKLMPVGTDVQRFPKGNLLLSSAKRVRKANVADRSAKPYKRLLSVFAPNKYNKKETRRGVESDGFAHQKNELAQTKLVSQNPFSKSSLGDFLRKKVAKKPKKPQRAKPHKRHPPRFARFLVERSTNFIGFCIFCVECSTFFHIFTRSSQSGDIICPLQ